MKERFDLVIFDCDGVLVDSERLAIRLESEICTELGWPLSESEVAERFVGRSDAYMKSEVERHISREIDWEAEFEHRYRDVFERELRPVPGVADALDQITAQTCVASSGSHDKMRFTLGLTGLYERFEGRIFSVSEVAHAKPAPDIFLHAAEQLGAEPSRCAVVEDSVSGVAAGVAAGMTVFAFTGSVTESARLSRDGVTMFDDMTSLPQLLASGSIDAGLKPQ